MANCERFRQTVLQLVCFVAAVGFFATDGLGQPPASDDAQLATGLAEFIQAQSAGKLARISQFDALAPLVELDGSGIAIAEGRLTWQVRQRGNQTADEQVAALANLEGLARAGLAHNGLDAEQVEPIIAGCEISLVPPHPSLSPLDLEYAPLDAVNEHLAGELERGRFERPEFAALSRVIDFSRGFQVEVRTGEVSCRIVLREPWLSSAIRQARALRRGDDFDWPGFARLEKNFLAAEGLNIAPLTAVVREALLAMEVPQRPGHRFSAESALAVHVWILPGRYDSDLGVDSSGIVPVYSAYASSAPGLREALPTSSTGSANRTVAGFRAVSLRTFPQVSRHEERKYREDNDFYGPRGLSPPMLVVDQQGFSGAVVNCLAFSPDGKRLAAAGDVLRIWNLETGALDNTVHVVHASRGSGLTSVAWSPDGKFLLVSAAGTRATIRIFDAADFSKVADVLAGHDGFVDRLAFSPDGRWLVSAGSDQRVYVWDWKSRQTVRSISLARRADFVAFPRPDRPELLVVDTAGDAAFVSAADVKPAQANASPVVQRLLSRLTWPDGGRPHPAALALHGSSRHLAIGGWSRTPAGDKFWVGLWSADGETAERIIKHRYYITCCSFSPDGKRLATADGLGAIAVYDVASGEEHRRFQATGQPLYAVEADAGGTLLVGRKPRAPGDWKLNWYGQLDQQFDLARRSYSPLHTARDPAQPVQRQAGLEIRNVAGNPPRLEIHSARGLISTLPFHDAAKWDALTYSFLQTVQLGAANPVVLGMESGELSVLDPATLLTCRTFAGHTDRVWSASESPDLRILYSASGDGTLRAWPLTEPRLWGGPAAHVDGASRVTHVVPGTSTARSGLRVGDRIIDINGTPIEQLADHARRGDWPFQVGEEGTVTTERGGWENPHHLTFSNVGDLVQPLYSLFVAPNGKEWVIWTPQGFYDASPGAESWVGWEIDRGEMEPAEFLPLEQFRKKFHRPDLIDVLIKNGRLPEDLELPLSPPKDEPAEFVSIDETPLILASPPRVRIVEPAAALITGQPEVRVHAEIRIGSRSEAEFGDPMIRVLVNGRPVPASRALEPVEERLDDVKEEHVWTIRQTVPLDPGENTIAIAAGTRGASSDPAQATVMVVYRTKEQARPVLDILAIGVGNYENEGIRDLSYPVADATEFAVALAKQAQPLYREVRPPVVLLDNQATSDGVRRALAKLVGDKDKNRTVVLFLAAHGCLDGKDYYLYTHDADPANTFASALPWSDLERAITNLAGCRVLLFVDTCHSAAVGMAVDPDRLRERALADEENGVFVFSACAARQSSHELDALGHGVFTRAMLDVLSDQAAPGMMARDVRLLEFASGVSARMEALCREHNLADKQELRFMQSKMSKDFVLYRQ